MEGQIHERNITLKIKDETSRQQQVMSEGLRLAIYLPHVVHVLLYLGMINEPLQFKFHVTKDKRKMEVQMQYRERGRELRIGQR